MQNAIHNASHNLKQVVVFHVALQDAIHKVVHGAIQEVTRNAIDVVVDDAMHVVTRCIVHTAGLHRITRCNGPYNRGCNTGCNSRWNTHSFIRTMKETMQCRTMYYT